VKQHCPFCKCELDELEVETVFDLIEVVFCGECGTMSVYTDDGVPVTNDTMADLMNEAEAGGRTDD
jgi:hypothetical protein